MTRAFFTLAFSLSIAACSETKNIAQPSLEDVNAAYKLGDEDLSKLCTDKIGYACDILGNRVFKTNESEAIEYFTQSCDLNYAAGCYRLGTTYERGITVQKDLLTAAKKYQKACTLGGNFSLKGRRYGCRQLGYEDHEYHGILDRSPLAEKFYKPLCKKGDANACFALGKIVALEEKTPTRDSKSIKLYIKGCNGGNATSCHMAAYMLTLVELFDGTNPYDPGHYTFKYWEKACDLGHKNSCNEVKKYNEGYGR